MKKAIFIVLLLALATFLAVSCGSSGSNAGANGNTGGDPTTPPPTGGTQFTMAHDRVFLVVYENQRYSDIIGNAAAPFFNRLAQEYGLATQFYANTQPSIGNYFMMTTGQIVTNDTNFAAEVDVDNLVRQFARDNKTWRAYLESLPAPGYIGPNVYPYAKRHNPFAFFTDVRNNPQEAVKLLPFGQFPIDLAANNLPQFVYLLPNDRSNMHDCPPDILLCGNNDKIAHGDAWLEQNIGPLLATPAMNNSLLIVTFDEGLKGDLTHGGGQIVTILVGPRVKPAYQSSTFYQHQSTLRLICDALQLSSCPGAGAGAPQMNEFIR